MRRNIVLLLVVFCSAFAHPSGAQPAVVKSPDGQLSVSIAVEEGRPV